MNIKILRSEEPLFLSITSEEDIEKNADLLSREEWKLISNQCHLLTDKFIEKFQEELDWYVVSMNEKISWDFIKKYKDKINFTYLFEAKQFTEEELLEFEDSIIWDKISYSQKLSENFIRKFQDKLNWNHISSHQKISVEFILEFEHKVNWNNIIKRQNLTEEFILSNIYKLDISNFHFYGIKENFSLKAAEQIIQRNPRSLSSLLSFRNNIPDEFLRKFVNYFDEDCWNSVSANQNLTKDFIKDFKENILFDRLSLFNPNLNFETILTFKDEIIPLLIQKNVFHRSTELSSFFQNCLLDKIVEMKYGKQEEKKENWFKRILNKLKT